MTFAIASTIIVATGSDCAFYRSVADALRAGVAPGARLFDAQGTRLVAEGDGAVVAPDADGARELAGVLRDWLGHVDALRESTAQWSLELLVRASVDHLGYS